MKKIKYSIAIAALAVMVATSGCATYHKTVTYNIAPDGHTNQIVVAESGRTDPLLTKTVENDVNGSGVDLDFMGIANYFSPFHLKFGNFDSTYRSLPTSKGMLTTAPYNQTTHQNSSIIQHAGDNNVSSLTNQLPAQAFIGPNVQVMNPIVQPTVNTPAVPATAVK